MTGRRGRQALVALLATIYAVCFVAIKAGLPFAPPLLFAALRALLGGVALLAALALLRRPLLPARRSWGWVVGLALTTTTLAFGGMFLSLGGAGAGIASVLGNMQPVVMLALAGPVLGERLTRRKGIALVLGTLGVLSISSASFAAPGAGTLSGGLLALAASGGLAIGSVLAKRMGRQPNLLAIAAWQMLLGGVPLLFASALVEHSATVVWGAELVSLLLFLAVAGTALPTPLWYWLLQGDEVGRLALALFLVPVFGLMIAWALFGERLGPLEAGGVALAIAGTVVAGRETLHGEPGPMPNALRS